MTRYASHHLYAPKRLVLNDPSMQFAPFSPKTTFCPLVRGVNWKYTSIGAWRGYGHWIEAVLINNRSALNIPLRPKLFDHGRIRGDWIASTFQHPWLEPVGSPTDANTSVLYLVGKHRRKTRCKHSVSEQ